MSIKALLENGLLSPDLQASIQEAWDMQLAEARQQIAEELRTEFAQKYEHDRKQIVESMNDLMSDVLKEELAKNEQIRTSIVEQATAKRKNMVEFVKRAVTVLSEQSKQQQADRKIMRESLAGFQKFFVKATERDLKECRQETQRLAATRVQVLEEGRKAILQAKKQFNESASKRAAVWIEGRLNSEMSELKTQINEARQAKYGMKLFEAAMEDFRTYFFNENKEVRALVESVKAKTDEVQDLKTQLTESKNAVNDAKKQARLLEGRIVRQRKLDEALNHLPREKRELMQELLESVPTERLDGEIKKYLPMVLKEDMSPRRNLSETRSQKKVVTGDREPVTVLTESVDMEVDHDIEHIIKLASY